jgi:hypothetical protein
MYTDQQKEDNNKTIYPTPVFEEVPPRLGIQNRDNGKRLGSRITEIMVNVWGQE